MKCWYCRKLGCIRRVNVIQALYYGLVVVMFYYLYKFEMVFFTYWRDRIYSGLHDGYLLDTPGCQTPQMDPFHVSVRHLINITRRDAKFCAGKDSPVIFRNINVPFLDETLLRNVYNITEAIRCYHWEVSRSKNLSAPDKSYSYGTAQPLLVGQPILAEYIYIVCGEGNTPFYSGYHMLAQNKSSRRTEGKHVPTTRMSVLVLGVDSVSRLNFNRHLNETGRYVREKLKALEFLGYNKVGDNSFPNQIPLLTGLSDKEAIDFSWNNFFDGIVALWDVYKERGHKTLYLEEMPSYGLFLFHEKNGFLREPTDYYSRPIMQAMELSASSSGPCVGSRLKTEMILDYIFDFIQLMGDDPFFAYVWITDLIHSEPNNLGYLDTPLTQFLERLSSVGLFQSTALVFLSDHGMRFGSLVRTKIGAQEDKSPFCFLRLPEWFLSLFPAAAASLKVNTRRLTTPYDVHATLLQLASLPDLGPNRTNKGLSLFREIPSSRTCEDAFIPLPFCACSVDKRRVVVDEVTLSYAAFFVAYLNAMTELHLPGKCLTWQLKTLEEVEIFEENSGGGQSFWLNVTTEPDAHFSVYGTLPSVRDLEFHKRIDFVDRLDWYSNRTYCLPPSNLQKYCICKS